MLPFSAFPLARWNPEALKRNASACVYRSSDATVPRLLGQRWIQIQHLFGYGISDKGMQYYCEVSRVCVCVCVCVCVITILNALHVHL